MSHEQEVLEKKKRAKNANAGGETRIQMLTKCET